MNFEKHVSDGADIYSPAVCFESAGHALECFPEWFVLDKRAYQEARVEVWVSTEYVEGVRSMCEELEVACLAFGGRGVSDSELEDAVERLAAYTNPASATTPWGEDIPMVRITTGSGDSMAESCGSPSRISSDFVPSRCSPGGDRPWNPVL